MDSGFLTLSVVFILLGVSGIYLFTGTPIPIGCSPDNPANACQSCQCPIPTPEPGAGAGTSSLFLMFGVIFFPMGLLKGGLPSFGKRTQPGQKVMGPGGQMFTPIQVASGGLFVLGLIVVLIGVDAVLVPGYLVLKSDPVTAVGALVAGMGALAMLIGWKRPGSAQA